jgi:hypothetical protein
MTPHIADLLPAYVNRTLDPAAMASVRDHLRLCPDCRVSHAAWQALAAATRDVAAGERWAPRDRFDSMSAILGGIASPLRETDMDATMTFPAPLGAGNSARRAGRRFGLTRLGRGLELVAALAIAAVVMAGFFAYRGGSPDGSGTSVPAAAQDSTPAAAVVPGCDVTPRTPEDLARVLAGPGRGESPFVEFMSFPKLPGGTAVEPATRAAIEATWDEYWHCDNNGQRLAAYALLTDDGVRSVFFRTTLAENTVDYSGSDVDVTAATPTPIEKPEKPEILPAPFRLTDGVVLADGRVLLLFNFGWVPDEAGPTGAVIFVRDGDGWLIDDYIFFRG